MNESENEQPDNNAPINTATPAQINETPQTPVPTSSPDNTTQSSTAIDSSENLINSTQPNNTKKNKPVNTSTIIGTASILASTIGIGLGIYGVIQSNYAVNLVKENVTSGEMIDETNAENPYAKPESASSISRVSIAYNKGKDFVYFIDDGEIRYYINHDKQDGSDENIVRADTENIINYIYNNVVPHIEANDLADNYNWSIIIESDEGISSIGGNDEQPEWFNALLNEISVDTNGYLSEK